MMEVLVDKIDDGGDIWDFFCILVGFIIFFYLFIKGEMDENFEGLESWEGVLNFFVGLVGEKV